MKVNVKLLGRLKARLPDGARDTTELDLPQGATPRAVLERLGLPLTGSYLITLNGERVAPEAYGTARLGEGDRLAVTPPLQGG